MFAKVSRHDFPQRREMLRENAFLEVLRESAGNPAGISPGRHGNFAGRFREYREMARVGVMIWLSSGLAQFKGAFGCAFIRDARHACRRAGMTAPESDLNLAEPRRAASCRGDRDAFQVALSCDPN
jgi:hypothetical protein